MVGDVIGELHLGVAIQLLVVEADLPHELSDVAPGHGEAAVLCLCLPELQDFADEAAESLGTLLYHGHPAACCRRQLAVVLQIFQWPEDEGEGSAQLVGDVGEEPEALLVELLFLLVFAPFQLDGVAQCESAFVLSDEPVDSQCQADGVKQPSPPGAPEGWGDGDVELCLLGVFPVL